MKPKMTNTELTIGVAYGQIAFL